MKRVLPLISFAGLALVVLPIIAYAMGSLQKPAMFDLLMIGTVLWFATAPWWMGSE